MKKQKVYKVILSCGHAKTSSGSYCVLCKTNKTVIEKIFLERPLTGKSSN